MTTSASLDLNAARAPLQRRVVLAYGVGDAGTGMASALVGFYLFVFYTAVANLPAWLAGKVIGAAAHGIPQVLLPLMADQFDNADALRQAGVAIVMEPESVAADGITDAITAALAGQLSPAARALQAEFAAMPNADAVVGALGLG